MARLLVRTAIANLRSRPLQTGLVALILAAASATLALAVSLRAGAADPYEQIARATNAADVHVLVRPGGRSTLAALARARGVRAADGPFRDRRRAASAAGPRTAASRSRASARSPRASTARS